MQFAGISYIAVLVAAVAAYAFGSVWYMALAKPWMAAVGKTEEEIKSGSKIIFGVAFIAQLVMAFFLAGMMAHLGAETMTIAGGLTTGFFVWLGFVITAMIVNHGFGGQKKMLTVIDGGHWLGVLLIQGLVIGWMGV